MGMEIGKGYIWSIERSSVELKEGEEMGDARYQEFSATFSFYRSVR